MEGTERSLQGRPSEKAPSIVASEAISESAIKEAAPKDGWRIPQIQSDTAAGESVTAASRQSPRTKFVILKIQVNRLDGEIKSEIERVLNEYLGASGLVTIKHSKKGNIPYASVSFESEAMVEECIRLFKEGIPLFEHRFRVDLDIKQ
jgi:tRNA(Ser,Leu) C12 N-acetylase TAN1